MDAHTSFLGDTSFLDDYSLPSNVPASQFLHPCTGRLAAFHPLHLRTIKRGMRRAAQSGRGYHLWWHPHNFGRDLEVNLGGLEEILLYFRRLHDDFGMGSYTMAEASK